MTEVESEVESEVEEVEPVEPVQEVEPVKEYDELLFNAWWEKWHHNYWIEIGGYESVIKDWTKWDGSEEKPEDWLNRYVEIKDNYGKRRELGFELMGHQIVMTDEVKKDVIEKMSLEKQRQRDVNAKIKANRILAHARGLI